MKFDRRQAIGLGLAGGTLAALPHAAHARNSAAVINPRVCGLATPLALGELTPRFSWERNGPAVQQAWRIRVARDEAALATGKDLLWDSGRVKGGECFDIAYGGQPLASRGAAVWQVEVETSEGVIHGPVSRWETGLAPADWQAQWIASETATARADRMAGLHWLTGADPLPAGRHRAFRWTFDLPLAGAVELCLSAHKTTGLWIDGVPAPEPRDGPARWTEMAVYPLNLAAGRHVVAVEVQRIPGFGVPPPVLAALLRHGAQSEQRLSSADAQWKVAVEPPTGWTDARFDDAGWAAAVAATGSMPVGRPWPITPASRLKRSFAVAQPVLRARLHASAMGVYEGSLNGQPLDDRRLAPEFTDPSKRVLYQTYDVTHLIRPGDNTLGFVVGDGWYGSRFSTSGRFSFGDAPCRLLAQLELEHADGSRSMVGTGPDWQIADAEILAHSIYDGEVHDARAELPGWSLPGATGGTWRPAEPVPAPPVAVEPQRCPPIRLHETLQPRDVRKLGPGHYTLDFGQNFAALPRLQVAAAAGTRIELRFAELVNDDGTVDQANLRTARARDIYIAAGRGRETWMPRFTYHGFRYVEVIGVPDDPAAWHLEAAALYQDLPLTGQFRCGDAVVQQFWRNTLWSQKSNFQGLPTDCPQRDERLGWMGDAQVFWPAAAWNMDVAAYTGRVMEDMRHGQSAKGGFPDCIPPFVPTMNLSSPGWGDAGIALPWTAWMRSGDSGLIQANWAAMQAWLAHILDANPNWLWQKNRGADYGDWLSVDAPTANPGAPTTPKDLVATAYWARNARMMAQMASAIGDQAAVARYHAQFEAIVAAFRTAWLGAEGHVGNGSQTGQTLAIAFDLLPAAMIGPAGRILAADIARRGNHLSTGFLGTPHILDALVLAGQPDVAITLLTQRTAPSWGYMVERGATSIWERWDSDKGDTGMNSRNHYGLGAIGDFLFRRVAGIEPLDPGFSRVRIAPIIDPRLGHAGATYHSVSGLIRTDWTVQGQRWQLDVEVPAGVSAEVVLPGRRRVHARGGANRYSGMLA